MRVSAEFALDLWKIMEAFLVQQAVPGWCAEF